MKKLVLGLIVIILLFLIIYPLIEIKTKDRIIKFSYSDDISIYEDGLCYDESYSYVDDLDISINDWDIYKFLFFYVIELGYVDGNICDSEYFLEESYINVFLDRAVIEDNPDNIDLGELIKGKTAVVGNVRYSTDDSKSQICYTLDGEYQDMFIFYVDDLLVIQVGLSDEGPRFIAYK